jgi:hypothetical protein
MISVVNLHSYKGKYVYIGRPSTLGNESYMHSEGERAKVIKEYRQWLWDEFRKPGKVQDEIVRLFELAAQGDLVLGCWCAPKPCHGDEVKKLLEWLATKDGFLLLVTQINRALGIKPNNKRF